MSSEIRTPLGVKQLNLGNRMGRKKVRMVHCINDATIFAESEGVLQ